MRSSSPDLLICTAPKGTIMAYVNTKRVAGISGVLVATCEEIPPEFLPVCDLVHVQKMHAPLTPGRASKFFLAQSLIASYGWTPDAARRPEYLRTSAPIRTSLLPSPMKGEAPRLAPERFGGKLGCRSLPRRIASLHTGLYLIPAGVVKVLLRRLVVT